MSDLDFILERIKAKKLNYQQYDFTRRENDALKTFFDLAQEFDRIEDFYMLCVAIPKSYFGLDARLFLVDARLDALALIAATDARPADMHKAMPDYLHPADRPYYTDHNSLVLTIRGKKSLVDQLPLRVKGDVLGLLEVYPLKDTGGHIELFFEKYANRIGFNIHNRFFDEKNIEHLKFIRSLVADIEHNIIVPNMVYKLFLKRLGAKVRKNIEIENLLHEYIEAGYFDSRNIESILKELYDVNQGLTIDLENIEKHYRNMSLFIETLFRKSHFDQGRLTLRTKLCNMKKDVVQPQLERYEEQFRNAGIVVEDRLSGLPEGEVIAVVDVGLIAQVYSNLFSNALKYTAEADVAGEKRKYISYGHEFINDFFGPGRDGIKYNVFSTGPHVPPAERARLFEEDYRASNAAGRPGTGHGLAFIKNVIEIHGGIAGYEPTNAGNNFYFILPKAAE